MSLDAEGTLQENSQREKALLSARQPQYAIQGTVCDFFKNIIIMFCTKIISAAFFLYIGDKKFLCEYLKVVEYQKVPLISMFFYKNYMPKNLLSFYEVLINWKDDRWENCLQDLTNFISKFTKNTHSEIRYSLTHCSVLTKLWCIIIILLWLQRRRKVQNF